MCKCFLSFLSFLLLFFCFVVVVVVFLGQLVAETHLPSPQALLKQLAPHAIQHSTLPLKLGWLSLKFQYLVFNIVMLDPGVG